MAMLGPEDILIDCSGRNSLLRDHVIPPSSWWVEATIRSRSGLNMRSWSHSCIVRHICDEYCKYYKNIDNYRYKFIPAVHRTYYDQNVSHVTGIVNISSDEFETMPSQFDGRWLRENFPMAAQSMDRFIQKIKHETGGEILGELEIIRIPLSLYRARNATSREWRAVGLTHHPFACSSVFLAGDLAIGSPYFQSISLGFECAMFLAGLLGKSNNH